MYNPHTNLFLWEKEYDTKKSAGNFLQTFLLNLNDYLLKVISFVTPLIVSVAVLSLVPSP